MVVYIFLLVPGGRGRGEVRSDSLGWSCSVKPSSEDNRHQVQMTTVIQQGEVIYYQEGGGLEGEDTEYED